jgi:hypothetical protein
MSKQFKQRPSQIINITNDYEAFCFDEACAYIISELSKENPKEPNFDINDKPTNDNNDLIAYLKANNNPR